MHAVRSLFIQPNNFLIPIRQTDESWHARCSRYRRNAFECLKKGRCKSDALDNSGNLDGFVVIGFDWRHRWQPDSLVVAGGSGSFDNPVDHWPPSCRLAATRFATERPTTRQSATLRKIFSREL